MGLIDYGGQWPPLLSPYICLLGTESFLHLICLWFPVAHNHLQYSEQFFLRSFMLSHTHTYSGKVCVEGAAGGSQTLHPSPAWGGAWGSSYFHLRVSWLLSLLVRLFTLVWITWSIKIKSPGARSQDLTWLCQDGAWSGWFSCHLG